MIKTTHFLLLTTLLLGGCYDMRAPQSALAPLPYQPQTREPQKQSHIKLIDIEVKPHGGLSLTTPSGAEGITQLASIRRYLKSVSKNSTIQLNVSPLANGKDLIQALDFCKSVGIKDVKIQRSNTLKKWTKKDQNKDDTLALKDGTLILHIKKNGTIIHNSKELNTPQLETLLDSNKLQKVRLCVTYRPPDNQIEAITALCMKHGVHRVILTGEH